MNGTLPSTPQPGTPIFGTPPRPLTRVDSRSNFQFRQPFPNQPGAPIRPGQPVIIRQPPHPSSPQFVQRNPVPVPGHQRPQVLATPPGQPLPLNPQNRPPFRPSTPFPRPPGIPNQRPLFHQRSVPTFGIPVRPPIQEDSFRSQTLDSSEIDHSRSSDDNKNTTNEYIKTPSIAAMNNRSYSLSSNHPEQLTDPKEEARRRSISSVDSYGEGRPGSRPVSRQGSVSGSNENLDKKPEIEIPSRPESRSMSRMNKIIEDEDRSPSSLTDVSQKSPDLSNLSDSVSKSQATVSKTPDSANISKLPLSPDGQNTKPQGIAETAIPIQNGTKESTSGSAKAGDSEKMQKGKSPNRSG